MNLNKAEESNNILQETIKHIKEVLKESETKLINITIPYMKLSEEELKVIHQYIEASTISHLYSKIRGTQIHVINLGKLQSIAKNIREVL